MKREFWVCIQEFDDEDGYVRESRDMFLEVDDEQPYSRPDVVIANAARSMVMDMLDLQTTPQEGGR